MGKLEAGPFCTTVLNGSNEMISRKSAMVIADAYTEKFSSSDYRGHETVYKDSFYDFLYEHDYESLFCNMVQTIYGRRDLKEWILRIHTGESLSKVTPNWSCDERKKLGQVYLKNLARDFMTWFREETEDWLIKDLKSFYDEMMRRLEMDGYMFRDNDLYQSEVEVLDVEAETGLLQKLYASLALSDQQTTFQFLKLAEEHYVAGRWSDCISNARKFFEAVLQQVSSKHSNARGVPLDSTTLQRPVVVREYLETAGLVEKKEREAIDKIYALLSHTGGHPYMAEEDQARLLRQLCLTVTQFVMLRLEGSLKTP
ncbi:MAG: hypothetical protein WAV28_12000 [Sedimentisphaerales bacterium]